jgi:hypothetical protein
MEPNAFDDDALLADLGKALASSRQPVAGQVMTGGRAAFSFFTMEEELAGLVYDSLLESEAVGAGRATTAARTVVFESDTVSVQMEIAEDGIVGQVVPTSGVAISAEGADGSRSDVATDEEGCFTLSPPGHGPVRLHITTPGATAVTEWAHLESTP